MRPAYERAAAELEPDYRLLKVNTEEEQSAAARYGIRSIPTLMLFMHGREIARRPGASETRGIVSWAKVLIGANQHSPARIDNPQSGLCPRCVEWTDCTAMHRLRRTGPWRRSVRSLRSSDE
jgi:hypothetical protein